MDFTIYWNEKTCFDWEGISKTRGVIVKILQFAGTPGARAKSQMTTDKFKTTKDIANLRIHVKRAINRIRFFRILKEVIRVAMVHQIDDMAVTCVAFWSLKLKLIQKESNWDHSCFFSFFLFFFYI